MAELFIPPPESPVNPNDDRTAMKEIEQSFGFLRIPGGRWRFFSQYQAHRTEDAEANRRSCCARPYTSQGLQTCGRVRLRWRPSAACARMDSATAANHRWSQDCPLTNRAMSHRHCVARPSPRTPARTLPKYIITTPCNYKGPIIAAGSPAAAKPPPCRSSARRVHSARRA